MHHPIFGKDPGPLNPNARPGFGKALSKRYTAWSMDNPGHSKKEGMKEHKRICDEITPRFPTYIVLFRWYGTTKKG